MPLLAHRGLKALHVSVSSPYEFMSTRPHASSPTSSPNLWPVSPISPLKDRSHCWSHIGTNPQAKSITAILQIHWFWSRFARIEPSTIVHTLSSIDSATLLGTTVGKLSWLNGQSVDHYSPHMYLTCWQGKYFILYYRTESRGICFEGNIYNI